MMSLVVASGRALAMAVGVAFVVFAAPATAEPNRAAVPDDDSGWGAPTEPVSPEPREQNPAPSEQTPRAAPQPPAPAMPPPRVVVAPTGRDVTGDGQPPAATKIEAEATRSGAPPSDLALMGLFGIMSYPYEAGGLLGGLSALYRSGLFGVGGFAEAGGLLMSMVSGGAMAGVASRTDGGFRAELLGTGGVRHYERWGVQLLSDDPGASATLPFVGACLRLGYIFGRSRRGHFNLGGLAAVDRDLWQKRKSYSYYNTGWFDDGSYVTQTRVVGGTRWALGLTLGATIDLGR